MITTKETSVRKEDHGSMGNSLVRRGFHPCFNNAPKPRIISWRETVPLVGSAAPITHAVQALLMESKNKCSVREQTITVTSNDYDFTRNMPGD